MRFIVGAITGSLIAAGVVLSPVANAQPYYWECPPWNVSWRNPACNSQVWNNPSWSPDVNEGGKWNPGGYTPCVTAGGCWRP